MPDVVSFAATVLPWLLAFAFAGAGVANLLGIGSIRADFARWGYPPGTHRVVGLIEIVGAGLLLHPAMRLPGIAVLGAVMLGALATLVRHHEGWKHLAPAIGLAGLLTVAGALVA